MTPARIFVSSLLLALLLTGGGLAQTTSTLSAETGNNTSAVTFPQHDNGNVAAGNVSKLDTHGLLYPGATTSIYAHYVPWFCTPGTTGTDGIQRCNGHILTGYNSNDATVVKHQVDDMISRGLQGAIIDWYGAAATIENGATLKMMAEAQSRTPVFQFAIMEDKGAVSNCVSGTGHSETQCVISDLAYIASTYYPSAAYMRRGGPAGGVLLHLGQRSHRLEPGTRQRDGQPAVHLPGQLQPRRRRLHLGASRGRQQRDVSRQFL
jgi:hypothetical protein